MAKTIAPLFSFQARGALANSLVYFPWKGINCVRQYVIPTNPQSDLQTSQRNKFTAAVSDFHASSFSTADISAWTRFAGTLAKVMTGFNAMCRAHVKEAILGNAWEKIWQVSFPLIQDENFDILVHKAEGGDTPHFKYGTRATYMPNDQAIGSDGVDTWRTTIADLVANTDYYGYVYVGASGDDYGRTGIYKIRTLAD